MTQIFPDTPPETERVLFAMLREMPPWRKLEMVAQLNQAGRELVLAGLRTRYPTATQKELHRRLADVLLGSELAAKVYGPLSAELTAQIDMNEITLKVETESVARLLAA
jgi:hypothetical protein